MWFKTPAPLLLVVLVVAGAAMPASLAEADQGPRARDVGVPLEGKTGELNAITDVAGLEVGHTTLISGSGELKVGEGPVRTGVTAILPRGREGVLVPVGREIPDHPAYQDLGSIIAVVATDAPLLPHQLKRIARRVSMGVARTGGIAGNGSGDIFIAFSTANPEAGLPRGLPRLEMLPNERITPFFEATVMAVEEAILNALVAAEDMTGVNDRTVIALPTDRLREVLAKYGRLGR